MDLRRSWNRNDPRFLRKQPGQCDLCGTCVFSLGDPIQKINHRLVCRTSLLGESREYCSHVRAFKLCRRNLARQETLSKRAPGNKTDSQLLADGKHFWFGVSRPYRILALDCGNRLDRVGAANGVCTRLRKAEVFDLPGLDQILDCAGDIFDGHIWIDAMLVKNIDDISLEAFE